MKKTIIADGVRPTRTKYDVQKLMKTREMEDYLSNKIPMQSDKLKVRLLNEGYLYVIYVNVHTGWERPFHYS